MLINCRECKHEVSDQAMVCPHCGCPISAKKTRIRRRRKLPNGMGSIRKLSGNRKNPYAVYPPVKEYTIDGKPVQGKSIGYYATYNDAMTALTEYNKNPYDLSLHGKTFQEVFDLFMEDKFGGVKEYSISSLRSYKAAFKNASALHRMPFLDIRPAHMQEVIDECPLKHASLELILNLFKQMYKYAMKNDMIDKDYSSYVSIQSADDDEKGVPFSQEEIDILWEHSDDFEVQLILVMIYSGFRIAAYNDMEYNFEEQYFKGGVKTKASKDRIVPFHRDIIPFIKDFSELNIRYSARRARFLRVLKRYGLSDHTPHDCRHTFSWLCDTYGVDDLSKHLMMGHAITKDVEASVYGHRTVEQLRTEINKICH